MDSNCCLLWQGALIWMRQFFWICLSNRFSNFGLISTKELTFGRSWTDLLYCNVETGNFLVRNLTLSTNYPAVLPMSLISFIFIWIWWVNIFYETIKNRWEDCSGISEFEVDKWLRDIIYISCDVYLIDIMLTMFRWYSLGS